MATSAYKYNNMILIQNGLSSEGVRQIKIALDVLAKKLNQLNDVDGLSIPFHLTPKDLLVCHVNKGGIQFYYVSRNIDTGTRKTSYSEAINVIDSRLIYHAIPILNNQSDKAINRYASVYRESKINGINLRYNELTSKAETKNDYSSEYRILNIDNIKEGPER